jgi:predicted permease
METFWNDIRFALRQLLRSPTFTAVAILSLALGIGANTAVFCLVNALLLRPLPVDQPERLVAIFSTFGDDTPDFTSWPNFRDFRERSHSFAGMAVHTNRSLTLGVAQRGEPEQIYGQMVSGNFFDLLGVKAARGRTFDRAESEVDGSRSVGVITHRFWMRRFGGDPKIVGRTLLINGRPVTVIGIAPKDFFGVLSTYPTDIFVPTTMWRQILTGDTLARFEDRSFGNVAIVARLAPGVSAASAQADMRDVARRLGREFPQNDRLGAAVQPLAQARLRPKQRKEFTLGATLLMAGAGMVLLIACVNLSSLLLGRVLTRQREIAVRTAIGAGQARLARMLMTESCLLALLGGISGLLLAVWLRRLFWALRPPRLPENMDISIDLRVFLFTLGLILLTGLLFGLAPSLQMRSRNLAQVLRGKSFVAGLAMFGQRWNLRTLLVSLQIALSLVSLVGGALFLRTLMHARDLDLGFEKEKLLAFSFDATSVGYDETRALQLYDQLAERIGSVPGVASAAVADSLNLNPVGFLESEIRIEGKPPDAIHKVQVNMTTPGYLKTVGIPLLEGRDFTAADRKGSPPVAVINEEMAREYWPGERAVGRRFAVVATGELIEVVGVARNARYRTVDEEPFPYVYRPIRQLYSAPVFLHVRTQADPVKMLPAVRREIRAVEPNLALTNLWTISDVLDRSLWASRMAAILLSAFGVLGLLLAMVGLYGALAYSVSRRQHEIGIRMALGAGRPEILWMIVRQGMLLAVFGLALGLLVSFLAARVALHSLSLPWNDPISFVAASLLLLLMTFLTNLIVARKATVIDPLTALRAE